MFGKKEIGNNPPKEKPIKLDGQEIDIDKPIDSTDSNVTTENISVKAAGASNMLQQNNLDDIRENEILVYTNQELENEAYREAKIELFDKLLEKVNLTILSQYAKKEQIEKIKIATNQILGTIKAPLNAPQVELLKGQIVDDAIGFGPLEVLMDDPDIADIMVNTANKVFIEKSGKIYLTDIKFSGESHLLNVIQKIVSLVGRRVDESSPMVDARMPDGSRFNAIIPPLALDGSLVSIRKFKQSKIGLDDYVNYDSLSPQMCQFLKICGKIKVNILISGGTGSGKTTLLNALSGFIDNSERIITIEDAAELQLKQQHVLRLETRPPNIEGSGEIKQRDLVKNALRMRPDRIILGEIRGEEVIDVLQAMNTGHEGSMATIHANNPRECLLRIENLIGLAGFQLPIAAMRQQIASAIHLIAQISRMRDGSRRITSLTEVVGLEGDTITMQELFHYKNTGMSPDGKLLGEYVCDGLRPRFSKQAEYYGLTKELEESIKATHNKDMA